jgi:NOL1/NOP2/sun family putative RNA methylase
VIPQAFIDSLHGLEGFDDESFIKCHENFKELTSIRLNTKKIDTLDFDGLNTEYDFNINKNVPWCKEGFYLKSRPKFTFDPLLHAGVYYVQEASSMFLNHIISHLFKTEDEKIILDLCAAPGGKTTLLANYFTNSLIVSNEVIKARVNILTENITKWGNNNCIVTNNDPKDFKQLNTFFDLIVIDAPCSGSGMFRKDTKVISEWSEQNVKLCSQRQQRIISEIESTIKDDGILIYSTCSYSKEENEDILDWMLQEFNCISIQIPIEKKWGIVETISEVNKAFGYRFYPNKLDGEGFFVGALSFKKRSYHQKYKSQKLLQPSKKETEIALSIFENSNDITVFKHHDKLNFFISKFYKELEIIAAYLYIKKAGVEIGMIKGSEIVPSHDLALASIKLKNFEKISLPLEVVLQYLSKKIVIINTEVKGWALVTYKNFNIGWIKVLNNRINNYYPTNWRILTSKN